MTREAASELQERGFVVIPGPEPCDQIERLADAYTAAVASAAGEDIRIGSTSIADPRAERDQVLACGKVGSLIVFNGSVWHGHAANASSEPRRSLQGAFIPRDGRSGTDFAARMQPETRARLGPLARHVLAL